MNRERVDEPIALGPRVRPYLAYSVAAVAGIGVGGRAIGNGLLLNWDQVIGSRIPMPPGFWAYGPELPRRVPFYVPFSIASRWVDGPVLVGVFLILAVGAAIVGTMRWLGNDVFGLGAGITFGLSAFMLTRAGFGHLPLVAATAMLPWAMRSIESGSRRSILAWGWGFGVLGSSGAIVGLIPAAIAVGRTPHARLRSLGLLATTQLGWVVPGIIVLMGGASFPSTSVETFATRIDGATGFAALFAGGGFFVGSEDVAASTGLAAPMLGIALLALGVAGLRAGLDDRTIWRSPSTGTAAAIAAAIAIIASATPIVGDLWNLVAGFGPFGLVREPHRLWPLIGLALLRGAVRTLRAQSNRTGFAVGGATLALGMIVAAPGLGGADGRLAAIEEPADITAAIDALRDHDGTTLVLPWRRYDRLTLSEGRNVLQPGPWILEGGVVLISGDPGVPGVGDERSSDRERRLVEIERDIIIGDPVVDRLRSLGIDRVIVMRSGGADLTMAIAAGLGDEPSVDTVVNGPHVMVLAIDGVLVDGGSPRSRSWVAVAAVLASWTVVIGIVIAAASSRIARQPWRRQPQT